MRHLPNKHLKKWSNKILCCRRLCVEIEMQSGVSESDTSNNYACINLEEHGLHACTGRKIQFITWLIWLENMFIQNTMHHTVRLN